jgi:hypothetical protein
MNVALRRLKSSCHGTQGVLILPDGVFCNTLELPWRENKRKLSCIPCGEYKVEIRNSPKFGEIYWVTNVLERDYILIHSGNLAGDTTQGLKSHVEGCILLGSYWGVIGGQLALMNSKPTVRRFMDRMQGESFTLIVEDERK